MLEFVASDRLFPDLVVPNPEDHSVPGAWLVGPDAVPVTGSVVREGNVVRCDKTSPDAAALALPIRLGTEALEDLVANGFSITLSDGSSLVSMGELILQTCLLRERDNPYSLCLELARHRVMLVLNKLEEWLSFEISDDDPVMRLITEARQAFNQALVALPSGLHPTDEVERLALRALWIAMEASERLAVRQVESDFGAQRRAEQYEKASDEESGNRPALQPTRAGVILPTPPTVGTVVSPRVFNDQVRAAVLSSSDYITLPMRWVEMEPAEGEYSFTRTDRWIEWAIRTAKMPVVAGPVVDFRPQSVPEWLYIWENDYDTLRELVYEHMKAVVTRYRRTVSRWTVCSGLHANRNFGFSFEQMIDLTRICVLVVRKLHPKAKVQVEIVEPWGEHHSSNRRSLPPTLYAEMLAQAGVQYDALSLRVQMGVAAPGLATRDLMAFSSMLDQYASLDRPVAISALGAPGEAPPPPATEGAIRTPGSWRRPWSPTAQADWASAYAAVALAKPFIDSVCWQEVSDPPVAPEMGAGGMLDAQMNQRPVFQRIIELRDAIKTGVLPAGSTDFASAVSAASS